MNYTDFEALEELKKELEKLPEADLLPNPNVTPVIPSVGETDHPPSEEPQPPLPM